MTREPECQLSCEYCLAGEGTDTVNVTAPRMDQVLAIPPAGCSVNRQDFQLTCREQSEGNCGKAWLADILYTTFPCSSCCNSLLPIALLPLSL